ncbi:sex-lethal homolog isoform X1 [Bactrocera neohumeralis]|uniref:sex-lethal homolog isoform X1 n=1 Tax=Bactrocera tryoni TaxID=59916 RepID=UPI001A99B8AF|nr:sex-lethal homolog isoform X1 [Bactrocera tryoni]XP_050329324.1 sex-lethal homolog isoform X1 [Bactrocera neohumeralis]
MFGNMNNGGHAPYGFNGYRPSGGRRWGMSHSLPSGMSRYAFSPQDTDFTSSYPGPPMNRRGYNDFSGGGGGGGSMGGGGGSAMGSMNNMAPAASTNSLNCGSGGGGGGGDGLGGGSNGTNLIVNYLPQDMTDRELYALFRTIGPINTCRIMRDYKTGYSFGYAFVDYASETDSQRAIRSLNGITVRNKRLKVSYARPGGESIKDTNLYVTNLPRTITDDQLDTIFGKYGMIVQKNILRDKLTGKPRGVAFVRFNKREEAQEAISALNNVIPEGGSQPLTVRLAEEHGKAKAQQYMSQVKLIGGGGGGGGGMGGPPPPLMNMGYNNMVHRDFNYSGLIDGLYRNKSYHYPYL